MTNLFQMYNCMSFVAAVKYGIDIYMVILSKKYIGRLSELSAKLRAEKIKFSSGKLNALYCITYKPMNDSCIE